MSMPYIGLYSFLHTEFQGKTSWKNRCQCPTSGFTHFYPAKLQIVTQTPMGVNALHRALLISTSLEWTVHGQQPCVNALHRALLISTLAKELDERQQLMCQCPTSGFTHFYEESQTATIETGGCQCPTSGFTHFYKETQKEGFKE